MIKALKKAPLFAGLLDEEIAEVAQIASRIEVAPGELLVKQNTVGLEVYIIVEGSVDVFIEGLPQERTLVVLGKGQVFGELALIDQGYRSASVRVTRDKPCTLFMLRSDTFLELCEKNNHIGFVVMRNLAKDVAFKLRHRNLAEM